MLFACMPGSKIKFHVCKCFTQYAGSLPSSSPYSLFIFPCCLPQKANVDSASLDFPVFQLWLHWSNEKYGKNQRVIGE